VKVRISDDAVALACGADAVAAAFVAAGAEVERVSSWGMHWLEPLVEIDGTGYGPVTIDQVVGIFGGTAQSIGTIADHPFIAKQSRLTFERAGRTRPLSLDDYAATGGWTGLEKARALGAEGPVSRLASSGRRSQTLVAPANISSAMRTKVIAAPLLTGW
jgi:formate dehydrogenase iron-sulfur subunit